MYRSFPSLISLYCRARNVQIHPLGLSFGLLLQNELETGIAAPRDCQGACPSKAPFACSAASSSAGFMAACGGTGSGNCLVALEAHAGKMDRCVK